MSNRRSKGRQTSGPPSKALFPNLRRISLGSRYLQRNTLNCIVLNVVYKIAGESSFLGKVMDISDNDLVDLYVKSKKSCAEIAKICLCSETKIYSKLKSLGVDIRSRSESNLRCPDRYFVLLYNLGLSSSQIGAILEIDPSTVKKRLRNLEFPLRARSVASLIRYTDDEVRKFFDPKTIKQLLAGVK